MIIFRPLGEPKPPQFASLTQVVCFPLFRCANSTQIHELVHEPATSEELSAFAAATTPAETELVELVARQGTWSEFWCGCGLSMHHGDCDAAVEDLKFQSDREYSKPERERRHLITPGEAWYSIRGSVVAFACNQYWSGVPVSRRDGFNSVFQQITDRCGWYVPGTWVNVERGSAHNGYMNYRENLDFCRDSTQSNQKKC